MSSATSREQFPVTKHWAFFDHAAVAPLSGPAQQAICEWAEDLACNGVVGEVKWLKRISAIRKSFAKLLNVSTDEIAFIKNTTEGIGFVAEGFPWKSGDNVITASEEYPSNIYPWMNLKSRGVEARLVKSRGALVEVDDLIAQMDERTRLVSLSFVEFSSGFRNDLDAIGQACRDRGIYLFVDAIQGLGVLPLDVSQAPIDFLSADGHKWLLGPEGAGIFYIRKDLIDLLHPIGVGWNSVVGAWDFSTIDFQLKPEAERWEGGTLNFAGIHGLGASLELLMKEGVEQIHQKVIELTDYLCEKAMALGVEVFSSRVEKDKSGIVSLVPKADVTALVKKCRENGIVVSNRAGRLRVSPHWYNTVEELDRLLEVLGEAQSA